jgi:4-hydroxymandelate oxidase
LVLTVDVPVQGLRENLVRANFATPPDLPFPNLVEPDQTLSVSELVATVAANFDPALTWADLDWLKSITALPIWVKGILRADDAHQAVEAGVAGIMVSNHGGRQLDTAIASIEALPGVVEAVAGQVDVLVDGGVRRGTDVIKALALGAKAVLLGRPPLWGLVVNGEAGARHVLELLRDELKNGMAQCGCPTLADIGPDLVC